MFKLWSNHIHSILLLNNPINIITLVLVLVIRAGEISENYVG